MRNFLLILAASFFLMTNGVQATEPVVPSPSVVIMDKAKGGGKCTATHIGDGLFLTAHHCFYKMNFPSNFGHTINNEPVFVAWTHTSLDITLVKVPTLTDLPSAELACRDPILGEPIVLEGNNNEWGWIRATGNVIGLKVEYEDSMYAFLHNGASVSGMSGGPVWDADGKILGISSARVNENPVVSIANPLDILCVNIPGTEAYKEKQEKKKGK